MLADNIFTFMCQLSRNSRSVNLLGFIEPVQAIIGIALVLLEHVNWGNYFVIQLSHESSLLDFFFFMLNDLSIYNTQHVGLVVTQPT